VHEYMYGLSETLLSFSTDELIGGLFFGLVLAIGMSGLYALLRRRVADTFTLLSGLIFIACVISMSLTVQHSVRSPRTGEGPLNENELWMRQAQVEARADLTDHPTLADSGTGFLPTRGPWGPPVGSGPPPPLGSLILRAADADHDGRLSPEEEAALFVKGADKTGEGTVEAGDIDTSLREHVGPCPGRVVAHLGAPLIPQAP
jgi:hypothetical protein